MARPRIRDFVTYLTTLPASLMIAACLFVPHTRSCNGQRLETPLDSDTWVVIVPLVVLGALPLAWHASAAVRRRAPELVLSFSAIVLSLCVLTIPLAIYLVWSYSKRTLRGEALVATCSVHCTLLWLVVYPAATLFDQWLPAAHATWISGAIMLAGFACWTSAAACRARNAVDAERLHVTALTRLAPEAAIPTPESRSCPGGTTRAA